MVADRRRWRQAWVLTFAAPPGRDDQFPTLHNGDVLAVLPLRTKPEAIETAMIAVLQVRLLPDVGDRFAFVVDEAPYTPVRNRVGRHIELDYPGLPVIVATRARVRMTKASAFEWVAEPWPGGVTAEDIARRERERETRGNL